MKAWQRIAFCLVTTALVAACAPLRPYRTGVAADGSAPPSATGSCVASDRSTSFGAVAPACDTAMRESGGRYDLYFAEFDDQGWLYPESGDEYGRASGQMDTLVADLQRRIDAKEPLSVVVFAHGWKHTARSDDSNVKSFRVFLEGLAAVERASAARAAAVGLHSCERHVVGVYLGWRGAATELGPIENITFWNRKEAAQRVAQGDARVLFAHLRALQDTANVGWNEAVERSRRQVARTGAGSAAVAPAAAAPQEASDLDPCSRGMRLSIAGHSFGGLIVYTSLAQALIRDVVELGHAEAKQRALPPEQRVRPILEREGDLVVVINPAIEASRLEPLFRAARDADIEHYNTPTFVSITSAADSATGIAFPVGRWFDTRFARYPNDPAGRERDANLRSFGHAEPYLTHRLATLPDLDARRAAPCEAWLDGEARFAGNLEVEQRVIDDYLGRLSDAQFDARKLGTSRRFCGGLTLTLEPASQATRGDWVANSPVWNVQTTKAVIADHNDFDNPLLFSLLRQLYIESVDRSVPKLRAIQQQSSAGPR